MTWNAGETELTFKDYYQILQLHPKVEAAMVDQAYWHLAQLYRDTATSDSSARAKLQDLNEAYTVLRSPTLRSKYDKVRDSILGKGALPAAPKPKPGPPPLAVMEKQRPRPREDMGRQRPRRFRPNVALLRVLPWRGTFVTLVVLVAATPALATGVHPMLVVGLLSVGIVTSTLLSLPRLAGLFSLSALLKPRLHRPTNPVIHLPDRRPTHTSLDRDTLRRSTDAMRARWREGSDSDGPVPFTPPQADHPGNSPHASNEKDSAA
jgi:curved DNA-binding protein CbpA